MLVWWDPNLTQKPISFFLEISSIPTCLLYFSSWQLRCKIRSNKSWVFRAVFKEYSVICLISVDASIFWGNEGVWLVSVVLSVEWKCWSLLLVYQRVNVTSLTEKDCPLLGIIRTGLDVKTAVHGCSVL